MKNKVKKILGLVLTLSILVSALAPVYGQTSQAIENISFDQEFAKVDEPLKVLTTLAGTVTYQWRVGNKVVSNKDNYTPTINDLENFIQVTASNGEEFYTTRTYFSRLPVIYIETENQQPVVSKDDYISGSMKIQGNTTYNSKTTKLYDGAMEIKGRGNSTWGLPKKPYKIKLDSKTDLFGMGKNKHWVLLANYYDTTSLRNTLSYDLSGALAMPQMQTVHSEVIFNGEYVGTYQFCEQIRVDEDRVDVLNWDDEAKNLAKVVASKEGLDKDELEEALIADMSWVTSKKIVFKGNTYLLRNYDYQVKDIDGGYLLEMDSNYDEVSKFKTDSNQPIMFKSPEFVNTNSEMMSYVKNYLQAFEDAVKTADFSTTYEGQKVHYSDLFDMDSLVDYWLVTELFFNEDSMKKSTYMYKDSGEKFHMGPIWDMDWSSGAAQSAAKPTDQWQTLYFPAYNNPDEPQNQQWYRYLIKDPYFISCLKERYDEIRNNQIQTMMKSIDGYQTYLLEASKANSNLWYANQDKGYQDTVDLKNWLTKRLVFLDEQFASVEQLASSLDTNSSQATIVLKDHHDKVLSKKTDYDAVTNANNLITATIAPTNKAIKQVALYNKGTLIAKKAVANGEAVFNYMFENSGTMFLQSYGYDESGKIVESGSSRVWVDEKLVQQVETLMLTSLPHQLTYFQGEALNLDGLAIKAIYNNGQEAIIDASQCDIATLSNQIGNQSITVSYQGKSTQFDVKVVADTLTGIQVTKKPTKLEYFVGDKLDLTGLEVTATYASGKQEVISGYEINGTTNKAGLQKIELTYQDKKADFEVNVLEDKLLSIEITKKPTKLEYFVGDKLDLMGLEVTATYASGKRVLIDDYDVSTLSNKVGQQQITIKYNGQEVSFVVTLKEASVIKDEVSNDATKEEPKHNVVTSVKTGDIGYGFWLFGLLTGILGIKKFRKIK